MPRQPACAQPAAQHCSGEHCAGQDRKFGRQALDAGKITKETGRRIEQDEGGRDAGCLARIFPAEQDDQRAEENAAAGSGQAREKAEPRSGCQNSRTAASSSTTPKSGR